MATDDGKLNVLQAGIWLEFNARICPLVPGAKNEVALTADWYARAPAEPPARFEARVDVPAVVHVGMPPEDIVRTVPLAPAARNVVAPGLDW